MESNEISIHQIKVYQAAKDHGGWLTAKEIAEAAGVARRTAAHHALRFVNIGVFEQAEVFPAHRYKLSTLAEKRDKAFCERLQKAIEVFA